MRPRSARGGARAWRGRRDHHAARAEPDGRRARRGARGRAARRARRRAADARDRGRPPRPGRRQRAAHDRRAGGPAGRRRARWPRRSAPTCAWRCWRATRRRSRACRGASSAAPGWVSHILQRLVLGLWTRLRTCATLIEPRERHLRRSGASACSSASPIAAMPRERRLRPERVGAGRRRDGRRRRAARSAAGWSRPARHFRLAGCSAGDSRHDRHAAEARGRPAGRRIWPRCSPPPRASRSG